MAGLELETKLIPGRSYLFNGNAATLESLLRSFESVDRLIIDAAESDVRSARQFVAQAQLGAFGERRLLLVKNADAMSETVQNTLLKLLEEPPPSVVIVLQTEQEQRLLPTVLSRLHALSRRSQTAKISAESHFQKSAEVLFNELIGLSREELIGLLASEMRYQQQQLLASPNKQIANRVTLLDLAVKKLNANANLKLTMDWLLLRWADN